MTTRLNCTRSSSSPGSRTRRESKRSLYVSNAGPPELKRYLRSLKKIRVFFEYAPGNGHQAATASMISRLRSLGFLGEIEILVGPETTQRLHYLIPGFQPVPHKAEILADGSTRQRLPGGRDSIVITRSLVETALLLGRVELAVTGAGNGLRAKQLNADVMFKGQPRAWPTASEIEFDGRESIRLPPSPGYSKQVAQPDNVELFLRSQMGHRADLRNKMPLLRSIVTSNHPLELLPMYGVGAHRDGPKNVAMIAQALEIAQRESPNAFQRKIVICILSNLNEIEIDDLRGRLSDRVELVTPPATSLPMSHPERPQVIIAAPGGTTQGVFDYLFYRATLGATGAGRNAQDLAEGIGIPVLNMTGTIEMTSHVWAANAHSGGVIKRAHNLFASNSGSDLRDLVSYFTQIKNTPSITDLFREQARARASTPDIVEIGLEALIQRQKVKGGGSRIWPRA